MGEELKLFRPKFNGSIRVEARPEHLTTDPGALLLRDVMERLGLVTWLSDRLHDPRAQHLTTHPFIELTCTLLLLLADGWRDQDDADVLRHDSALRLAVSQRRGISPLDRRQQEPGEELPHNPPVPDGLASQPTLSRHTAVLSLLPNQEVLRESLIETASRRIRMMGDGHRLDCVTLDVDSLPIDVYGHQPGSKYNGYYRRRIFHPLICNIAETGDVLGARLREGNVHTAEGGLSFILPLIERAEEKIGRVASVRFDAGFPEDELLCALEERGTGYVARVKNNAVLDKMAAPYLKRPPGRPPAEPRTWAYETTYKAGAWTRARRVVLIVLERPGELFLHHFWLITNWTEEQMDAWSLLELYRERGTAEGHYGEFVNVLEPALSSSPRTKMHYRNREPENRTESIDTFAQNETILLLNLLAYNIMHTARKLLNEATGQGWSIKRVRERVLRIAARIVVSARYATVVISRDVAHWWRALCAQLTRLPPAPI